MSKKPKFCSWHETQPLNKNAEDHFSVNRETENMSELVIQGNLHRGSNFKIPQSKFVLKYTLCSTTVKITVALSLTETIRPAYVYIFFFSSVFGILKSELHSEFNKKNDVY